MDVRFTDRDVILARLTPLLLVTHSSNGHFSVNLQVQTVAGTFTSLRGWTAVDGYLVGKPFHFVETHLEAFADPIRDIQAQELLAGPASVDGRLLIAADFNFDDTSAPYALYTTTGGFTDAWRAANDGDPGFSCCQNGDLSNPTSLLNDRIDLVFFRGPLAAAAATLVGDQPEDRTPSGLWPSDHAGVVAALRF
jgi:endonuclease/exonuclease/phosphatase family metal-dependent hydrolase